MEKMDKSEKKVVKNVCLTPDLLEKVRAIAKDKGLSFSAYISFVLTNEVKKEMSVAKRA